MSHSKKGKSSLENSVYKKNIHIMITDKYMRSKDYAEILKVLRLSTVLG